jgi:hypothetical protein
LLLILSHSIEGNHNGFGHASTFADFEIERWNRRQLNGFCCCGKMFTLPSWGKMLFDFEFSLLRKLIRRRVTGSGLAGVVVGRVRMNGILFEFFSIFVWRFFKFRFQSSSMLEQH